MLLALLYVWMKKIIQSHFFVHFIGMVTWSHTYICWIISRLDQMNSIIPPFFLKLNYMLWLLRMYAYTPMLHVVTNHKNGEWRELFSWIVHCICTTPIVVITLKLPLSYISFANDYQNITLVLVRTTYSWVIYILQCHMHRIRWKHTVRKVFGTFRSK